MLLTLRQVGAAFVIVFCLAVVPSAYAQGGVYVAATAGKAWFGDDAFEGAISGDITQSFSGEFGAGGLVGYAFGRAPLGLEGEFWAMFADVAELRNTLTTFKGGSDRHLAAMVNATFRSHSRRSLSPWASAGVGVDVERWGLHLVTPAGVSTEGRFDTRPFFAWQAKAGVACAVNDAVEVLAGYRYFRTQGRELDSPSSQTPHPHDPQAAHVIEVGLRWGAR